MIAERHGDTADRRWCEGSALAGLSGGIRAPSTLGSHLRSCTWGNIRQLERVNRLLLGELARRAPLLPGRDTLAFIDIDAMQNGSTGTASRAPVRAHQDTGQRRDGSALSP